VNAAKTKPGAGDWRNKLHPVFFELAECNKEFEARFAELQEKATQKQTSAEPSSSTETKKTIADEYWKGVAALDRWYEERLIDINERHKPLPYNPLAFSYLTLDQPISDQQGIEEYLHFHRHGESLNATEANDAQGDLDAWDKISRTGKDLRRIVFGKGPIKPFQENPIHRQLLQIVIAFETEPLTAEELAACFDLYCACGKDDHDADSLRKMRHRLEADLQK
jgi:hypothetical protein